MEFNLRHILYNSKNQSSERDLSYAYKTHSFDKMHPSMDFRENIPYRTNVMVLELVGLLLSQFLHLDLVSFYNPSVSLIVIRQSFRQLVTDEVL